MNSQTVPDFHWLSPLGISTASFTACGAVYTLIALIGMVIIVQGGPTSGQFFLSARVDTLIFGKSRAAVAEEHPQFARYIFMLMIVFCSFMTMSGLFQLGVALVPLKAGQPWALWTSVAANAFMLAVYWLLIIAPVMREFHVGYFSMWHPYAFIPTLLLPVGTVSGWLAMRS